MRNSIKRRRRNNMVERNAVISGAPQGRHYFSVATLIVVMPPLRGSNNSILTYNHSVAPSELKIYRINILP